MYSRRLPKRDPTSDGAPRLNETRLPAQEAKEQWLLLDDERFPMAMQITTWFGAVDGDNGQARSERTEHQVVEEGGHDDEQEG